MMVLVMVLVVLSSFGVLGDGGCEPEDDIDENAKINFYLEKAKAKTCQDDIRLYLFKNKPFIKEGTIKQNLRNLLDEYLKDILGDNPEKGYNSLNGNTPKSDYKKIAKNYFTAITTVGDKVDDKNQKYLQGYLLFVCKQKLGDERKTEFKTIEIEKGIKMFANTIELINSQRQTIEITEDKLFEILEFDSTVYGFKILNSDSNKPDKASGLIVLRKDKEPLAFSSGFDISNGNLVIKGGDNGGTYKIGNNIYEIPKGSSITHKKNGEVTSSGSVTLNIDNDDKIEGMFTATFGNHDELSSIVCANSNCNYNNGQMLGVSSYNIDTKGVHVTGKYLNFNNKETYGNKNSGSNNPVIIYDKIGDTEKINIKPKTNGRKQDVSAQGLYIGGQNLDVLEGQSLTVTRVKGTIKDIGGTDVRIVSPEAMGYGTTTIRKLDINGNCELAPYSGFGQTGLRVRLKEPPKLLTEGTTAMYLGLKTTRIKGSEEDDTTGIKDIDLFISNTNNVPVNNIEGIKKYMAQAANEKNPVSVVFRSQDGKKVMLGGAGSNSKVEKSQGGTVVDFLRGVFSDVGKSGTGVEDLPLDVHDDNTFMSVDFSTEKTQFSVFSNDKGAGNELPVANFGNIVIKKTSGGTLKIPSATTYLSYNKMPEVLLVQGEDFSNKDDVSVALCNWNEDEREYGVDTTQGAAQEALAASGFRNAEKAKAAEKPASGGSAVAGTEEKLGDAEPKAAAQAVRPAEDYELTEKQAYYKLKEAFPISKFKAPADADTLAKVEQAYKDTITAYANSYVGLSEEEKKFITPSAFMNYYVATRPGSNNKKELAFKDSVEAGKAIRQHIQQAKAKAQAKKTQEELQRIIADLTLSKNNKATISAITPTLPTEALQRYQAAIKKAQQQAEKAAQEKKKRSPKSYRPSTPTADTRQQQQENIWEKVGLMFLMNSMTNDKKDRPQYYQQPSSQTTIITTAARIEDNQKKAQGLSQKLIDNSIYFRVPRSKFTTLRRTITQIKHKPIRIANFDKTQMRLTLNFRKSTQKQEITISAAQFDEFTKQGIFVPDLKKEEKRPAEEPTETEPTEGEAEDEGELATEGEAEGEGEQPSEAEAEGEGEQPSEAEAEGEAEATT